MEKDCAIVYGVVGHTEFRYDGVCSESVLGDFPETIVGNCVLLQWEYLLYIYGLGPGIFYNVLPQIYYQHFCKLVFGICIINQHKIKTIDLKLAHQALIEFANDFEMLYYQCKTQCLHFVRQSIHALTHLAPGVVQNVL